MATPTIAPQQAAPAQVPVQAVAPAPAQKPALDTDIVNLAKAIRSVETKGQKDPYTAKGASGEFGAYQYTDGTWQADAKAYLGKAVPLASATREQQNEVAYKKLESLKAQGYNPGQIASIWNSGGPDWKGKVGVNKYGVKYDVPKYVDAVASAYQSFKGGSDNPVVKSSPSTVGQEQILSPEQQADYQSGQDHNALFPAVTGESPLAAGLKTAGNLIPSAFNFVKGAISTLNPINTVKNLAAIPGAFSGLVKESGGILPALGATAKEIPMQAARAIVPEAGRDLSSAAYAGVTGDKRFGSVDENLSAAQRAVENDPVGSVAPFVFGARAGAGALDSAGLTKGAGAAVDSVVSKTADVVTKPASYAFGKIADTARGAPAATSADISGKILQGTERDAQIGAKVLSRVDTTGVKTYEDLSKKLDTSIKTDLAKVDQEFATSKTRTKLADLKQSVDSETASGVKASAQINYVKEALSNLQELYFKTKDPANEARVKALTTQAKRQGLTAAEINEVAREYGTEFGSKAFSKRSGDPLTSINAQAYENIRTGLKETARSFLQTDDARALDKGVGQTIKVKKLVDDMAEKVNKLEQRINQRNIVEKVARGVGVAVDTLTGGALKAFVQKLFFPSNVGLKTLNSIDLEGQLKNNLSSLKSLEGASDATLINMLIQGMQKVNHLPEANVPYIFGKKQPTEVQ